MPVFKRENKIEDVSLSLIVYSKKKWFKKRYLYKTKT